MKAGNPRQVAILSIVAVLAVGFVIHELIGGHPPVSAVPTRAVAVTPTAVVLPSSSNTPPSDMSSELSKDPFSHPKLAGLAIKVSEEAPSKTAPRGVTGGRSNEFLPMPVAGAPLEGGIDPSGFVRPAGHQDGAHKPEEIAGQSRPKDRGKPVLIKLQATLRVNSFMALISVDGGESRSFAAGDSLGNYGHVVTVDDGGATIRLRGRNTRLQVGQEVKI